VIEGHLEHLLDRHARLPRPGEQVPDVLRIGADHLRAEEAAALAIAVDAQVPAVAQHHARTPLVLEGDLADRGMLGGHGRVAARDDRHLRIGEDDSEPHAAQLGCHARERRGVGPGDAPFVGGLVQQRRVVRRVACDEDVARARLQRPAIEHRHAPRVERDAGVLETELVHVGNAPRRGEHVLEALAARLAVGTAIVDDHAIAIALDTRDVRVRVE